MNQGSGGATGKGVAYGLKAWPPFMGLVPRECPIVPKEVIQVSDLYIVLLVTLFSWAGIFLYLLRMENRVKELEKK